MKTNKNKIKRNKKIKNFFNKLYVSFPNVTKISDKHDLIKEFNINYVYFSNEKDVWFAKRKNENEEIFLFGKSDETKELLTPSNKSLKISFDKDTIYSGKFNGILTNNEVFIDNNYFNKNYPNFKTKLPKKSMEIIDKNIEVIILGNYSNSIEFYNNLKILLEELNHYKPIKDIDNKKSKKDKTKDKYCSLCNKKLKENEEELCNKCSKKRYASKLLKKILKFVDPEIKFDKNNLPKEYYNEIQIHETIWTLQEVNLLDEKDDYCILKNKNILDNFIKKYYIESKSQKTIDKKTDTPSKKITKKCIICEKTLPTSKFYKSDKFKDGFEDYCKNCKKKVNTANYLKEILNYVEPEDTFKKEILPEDKNSYNGILGKIWALQDADLIIKNDNEETYILTDSKTCENYLNKYYIEKEDKKIKSEKPQKPEKQLLTKKEQMKIVINSISSGKTNKEAAELASIPIYKITHWYKQGKDGIGKDNVSFYKKYNRAMKEFELNSIKDLYIIESFNKKDELSIADSLRKQQMEIILKNLGQGKNMKNAAYAANITNETLQQWYKRGQNKLGAEYHELFEKINIITSPIKTPKPDEETEIKKETEKTDESEFEGILNLLPVEYAQYFKYESESGFAWVNKRQDKWIYSRKVSGLRQQLSSKNLYILYLNVNKKHYVWGVRDLTKAKESLASCEKPKLQTSYGTKRDFQNNKKIKTNDNNQIENNRTDTIFKEDNVTCITFDSKSHKRVIISGLINSNSLMNTLYNFKIYENDITKIITNNQNAVTEIFIELKINNAKINIFREKIKYLGWKMIN